MGSEAVDGMKPSIIPFMGRSMPHGYRTHALGETLHTVAAHAHRRWPRAFGIDRRYASLFPQLPKGAQWADETWCTWERPWLGPQHNVHVRDTVGYSLGASPGPLFLTLPRPPRQREASYALILPHSATGIKEWSHWEALQKMFPWDWRICTRDPSFEALCSLIADAACCVAVDSGPLHLAAAYGVPVLGLYGATSSTTHGPYGVMSVVDRHREAWASTLPYNTARYSHRGMRCLSLEDVQQALIDFQPLLPSP